MLPESSLPLLVRAELGWPSAARDQLTSGGTLRTKSLKSCVSTGWMAAASMHDNTGATSEELGVGDGEGRHMDPGSADVPAMPDIPRDKLDADNTRAHILAPEEGKHLTGWRMRGDRNDGAEFVVISVSILGRLNVIKQFPVTEDGWRQAWQALVRTDAFAAKKAQPMLAEQALQARAKADLAELKAATIGYVPDMIFLGGHAPESELAVRGSYDLRFLADSMAVFPSRRTNALVQVPYRDIDVVDIGGPGLVKSGGGFVGGGFGVAGAVESMAIATALNTLTTKTKIRTVVRIQAVQCELFLLCTTAGPEALRIGLSQALGAIRHARAGITALTDDSPRTSLVDQLAKLAAMLESGC